MARILLVEDEPHIALTIQEALSAETHSVAHVADGESGLRRARTDSFDLIVLDIMLPGKDGYQVCRELRASGLKMPVLMLSARNQEVEKVVGLNLGADDYLGKPFGNLELCARVNALLRRADVESPQHFRFGEVEVDVSGYRMFRAGKPVAITPLEFKILLTLIRARGRVLSRSQLIDAIWSDTAGVTDRVIDTHVANIRKKIEPDPLNPVFLTSVRGVGYRFDG